MNDSLAPKQSISLIPANEPERLAALYRYDILDTSAEVTFDRVTSLAARLFQMPTVLISLVDESRAWFKSSIGFDASEVPRDSTICSFTVLTDEPLIVPDTQLDERFVCNPFVMSEPGLRFYAGAPLISHDGFNLGTLCLLDTVPHDPLTAEQQATLVDLAAIVIDELELRLAARQIARVDAALVEITHEISTVTGGAFIDGLVQQLAKVLDTDYAYVGLIEGDDQKMMRTIATCAGGEIVYGWEYLLKDTPCWEVIEQRRICSYPRNVQSYFPNAPLLKPLVVESYAATPFYDARGEVLGVLGVMDGKPLKDVHLAESLLRVFSDRIATEIDRQQAERDLRQSQAVAQSQLLEIEAIYQTAPIGLTIIDVDLRFQRINQRLADINGIAMADHLGRTVRDVIGDLADGNEPLLRQVLETGKPLLDLEFSGETSAQPGIYRTWISNFYPLNDSTGQTVGVNVVVQEITDRKQLEKELEERNQELNRFSHTVSHDLKAPLRGISNLAAWISEDLSETVDPDILANLKLMQSRVSRMDSLIDGLLDYAKVGNTEASLETFSVEQLLSEIVDSLSIPDGFVVELPAELPPITTNRVLLSQVLANLIGNAYKHHDSPDGRIKSPFSLTLRYGDLVSQMMVLVSPQKTKNGCLIFLKHCRVTIKIILGSGYRSSRSSWKLMAAKLHLNLRSARKRLLILVGLPRFDFCNRSFSLLNLLHL
jgi:PAS domain S-box-containing protein